MDCDAPLRHDGRGVWLRICDEDGFEQSSVLVIGDYTIYAHSFENGKPLLLEYEHEDCAGLDECHAIAGLARRLACPDGDKLFAAGGTQLLVTA